MEWGSQGALEAGHISSAHRDPTSISRAWDMLSKVYMHVIAIAKREEEICVANDIGLAVT
jgi:hypothetical protein